MDCSVVDHHDQPHHGAFSTSHRKGLCPSGRRQCDTTILCGWYLSQQLGIPFGWGCCYLLRSFSWTLGSAFVYSLKVDAALAELEFGSVTTLKKYPSEGNWKREEFKDRDKGVGSLTECLLIWLSGRLPEGVFKVGSEEPVHQKQLEGHLNAWILGSLLALEPGGGTRSSECLMTVDDCHGHWRVRNTELCGENFL